MAEETQHLDCDTCKHLLNLTKHPESRGGFKGSITDETGLYCCTGLASKEFRNAIVFTGKGRGCEIHTPIK